jgi:hypothetical protein
MGIAGAMYTCIIDKGQVFEEFRGSARSQETVRERQGSYHKNDRGERDDHVPDQRA